MNSNSMLPSEWNLPEELRDRLGSQPGRQRAMLSEGHLLLILHAPPKANQDDRDGRFFWRPPKGDWRSNLEGAGLVALDDHISDYADDLDELETRGKTANSADEYFGVIEDLAPLYRASGNLHHVLHDARQLCPTDRDLINVRDRAYSLQRRAELLMTQAKASLDFAVAKRAEDQANASRAMAVSSHRLNVLVAFFLPMATLAALFGMNLSTGLESQPGPQVFVGLVVLGLLAGSALTLFVMRRPR